MQQKSKKKQITILETLDNSFSSFITLGHNSLKLHKSWHNYLATHIFGTRNKTAIINIESTFKSLLKSLYVFTCIIKLQGDVLIVNTNPELCKFLYHMRKNIHSPHILFADCAWTKGTLSNWNEIINKIKTFTHFYYNFDSFLIKNNIHFPNYKKMKKNFKGFIPLKTKKNDMNQANQVKKEKYIEKALHWKPNLIILVSTDNTQNIIQEAVKLNIPTLAFVDSNCDVSNITYPIIVNAYSHSFALFFLSLITKITNKYSKLKVKN